MAAQLIASHKAAMECYRRAMVGEQTFEGRREALNQANKLSGSFATLLETLNQHRGKGQQKVTVEHVHVHSGGQAIVGAVAPGEGMLRETISLCGSVMNASTSRSNSIAVTARLTLVVSLELADSCVSRHLDAYPHSNTPYRGHRHVYLDLDSPAMDERLAGLRSGRQGAGDDRPPEGLGCVRARA